MKWLIAFDIFLVISVLILFCFVLFLSSCAYIRNDVDVDKLIREPGRVVIKEEPNQPPIKRSKA